MDWMHGEGGQTVQWCTLDCDPDGDERVIDHGSALSDLIVRAGARDLQVGEVDEFGEGRNEGRNVCRCVEKRRILFNQKILHLPAPVLWCLVFRRAVLRILYLRLVDKLHLCPGLWVNDRWQEGLGSVRHVESERLDVASYPGKGFNARGLGKG